MRHTLRLTADELGAGAIGWELVEGEFLQLPMEADGAAQVSAIQELTAMAAKAAEQRRVDELAARKREIAEKQAKAKAEKEAIKVRVWQAVGGASREWGMQALFHDSGLTHEGVSVDVLGVRPQLAAGWREHTFGPTRTKHPSTPPPLPQPRSPNQPAPASPLPVTYPVPFPGTIPHQPSLPRTTPIPPNTSVCTQAQMAKDRGEVLARGPAEASKAKKLPTGNHETGRVAQEE